MHDSHLDLLSVEPTGALPRVFKDFRGYHSGETLLVCGCGSSLSHIIAPERLVTIGVNDVGRLFDPDYLVVLNARQQFSGDRFRFVEHSRAKVIFSQLDLGIRHPHLVRVRLGHRAGTDFSDPDVLPYTHNSPYPAVCLAVHMGARRIGVIGVDFTDHHFFAPTGRHPLTGQFGQIDHEYRQLYESCARRGVEIFNLSGDSRLTAFPRMAVEDFLEAAAAPAPLPGRKLFFVNYRFLSCGSVFQDGLAHAADQLQTEWKAALWDDPQLAEKVDDFKPDLLFVVHGRKFCARWGTRFAKYKTAVWLLDEPYEVDDTSRFSPLFGTVFLNDPNTLQRHRNAQYLPVCYDPKSHFYRPCEPRPQPVGFVGGGNPRREEALARLARRGLLSYVVGGPWHHAEITQLCRSGNIPAEETASLYRGTRLIVNVFRDRHHYNHTRIPAVSLNPRVYEALGCGALPVCEYRPELDTLCPELPAFRTLEEMEDLVTRYLADEDLFVQVRRACIRRLAKHTYAARLATAVRTCLNEAEANMDSASDFVPEVRIEAVPVAPAVLPLVPLPAELAADWEADAGVARVEADGTVALHRTKDEGLGSERGLIGKASLQNFALEFDVCLQENSGFIAKIHQVDARNQSSNSYHVMYCGARAYLARHNHILCNFSLPVNTWLRMSFSYLDAAIVVRNNGAPIAQAHDRTLEAGHCFLGVKSGTVRLRNISIRTPGAPSIRTYPVDYEVVRVGSSVSVPAVSIVTTVYDRVRCLESCLQSVQALHFKDYEHIIVADAPPPEVLREIENVVTGYSVNSGKISLATLKARKNDWGISPAAAGLTQARGKYICFLSDDNGYMPNHLDKLVQALESDSGLGFAYSSCQYAGRALLRENAPRAGSIDLGQPLFRRELFGRYLGGAIPFHEFGWDWKMIESFLRNGVRWRHVDDATFVFRLANYPHLMANPAVGART